MDLQRVAGQGEAKAQQNPQPQAPPTAPGGAEAAPVGFGVRFRITLASRALPVCVYACMCVRVHVYSWERVVSMWQTARTC